MKSYCKYNSKRQQLEPKLTYSVKHTAEYSRNCAHMAHIELVKVEHNGECEQII